MFSYGHEAFEHQRFELLKELRSLAAKDINVLLCQFEGRRLKVKVARTITEHEAEVDVYHVANRVQKDVTVVSILDLQDIAQ